MTDINEIKEAQEILNNANVPTKNRLIYKDGDIYESNPPSRLNEIKAHIKQTKSLIKRLRAAAKENSRQAEELCRSNAVLIRQIKRVK